MIFFLFLTQIDTFTHTSCMFAEQQFVAFKFFYFFLWFFLIFLIFLWSLFILHVVFSIEHRMTWIKSMYSFAHYIKGCWMLCCVMLVFVVFVYRILCVWCGVVPLRKNFPLCSLLKRISKQCKQCYNAIYRYIDALWYQFISSQARAAHIEYFSIYIFLACIYILFLLLAPTHIHINVNSNMC